VTFIKLLHSFKVKGWSFKKWAFLFPHSQMEPSYNHLLRLYYQILLTQIIHSKYLSTHNWQSLAFPGQKGKQKGLNIDVLATVPWNPPLTHYYIPIYLHHISSDHLTSHVEDTIYLLYSTIFCSPATIFILSFISQYHFCRPLNRVICEFKVCHFLSLSTV